MKRISFAALIVTLLLLALNSCDIIEAPYLEQVGSSIGADSLCVENAKNVDPFAGVTITKKVLLEEFTGHKCGNCPQASEIAVDLRDNEFPNRMFLMSVHAGNLAEYEEGASKYFTNFTTPEGDELFNTFFPIDAVPFALINRTESSLGYLWDKADWRNQVEAELNRPAEAGIHITNCFNESSRKLTVIVQVKYLTDATDQEYLSVFLVEDDVVDWQKDYRLPASDEDISDYKHHDVMRKAINGTWGLPLSTSQVMADDTFMEVYSLDLDENFDQAHCRILAFVHNFDTKEIRQVEMTEVIP